MTKAVVLTLSVVNVCDGAGTDGGVVEFKGAVRPADGTDVMAEKLPILGELAIETGLVVKAGDETMVVIVPLEGTVNDETGIIMLAGMVWDGVDTV